MNANQWNRLAGILNLNKPPGMTSRAAVDCVKRLVRPAKVGHAGTLDPLASGVLVVCIGKATRLIEFVQQMPKRYRATFLLGRTSPTEDLEGEITELIDPPLPSRDKIERACERFVGTIEQRPPAFSALKIAGQRAYDLARRGQAVELAPRPVTIYGLMVVEYEYPLLTLDIRCGAGTYVRSLGRDLAESLGTGAVMSALVRTEIGLFRVENGSDPHDLNSTKLERCLQPPQVALDGWPQIVLDDRQIELLARGGFVDRPDIDGGTISTALLVALDQQSTMLAVLKRHERGGYCPYINFIGKG
jgi:tRNA pseudouridine55 synthase